jgi:tetratricopeptide (TPR) repeat protein
LAAADAALPALQAAAVSPYERFVAAQTEFRIASAQNNAARQLTAIDAMADSEGAPAADAARVQYAAGSMAYNANDFAKAARRFERAIALNSAGDNLPTLYAVSLIRSNQIEPAMSYIRQQISAANGQNRPSEQFLSLSAQSLQNAGRDAELLEVLGARARLYPTPTNVRILGAIMLRSPSVNGPLALDILRTMLAGNGMNTGNASNDRRFYNDYVQAARDANIPGEVVSIIRAGRAAGAIAQPDRFFDEQYTSQNAEVAADRASLAGSARRAETDPTARTATLTGDAYMSYEGWADAERLYQMALSKSGADTNLLNLRIGMVRFRAGNLAGAQEALRLVQGERAGLANVWLALIEQRNASQAPASTPAPAAATATN